MEFHAELAQDLDDGGRESRIAGIPGVPFMNRSTSCLAISSRMRVEDLGFTHFAISPWSATVGANLASI